jgi:hypothetical protein
MKERKDVPVEVVLEGEVLGHQYCLTILFHHVEVIRRVNFALKEDTLVIAELWKDIVMAKIPHTC